MSLINDALKKAQRQRTNNPFGINAPMPGGGGRVGRRGSSGMPTQTLVLIGAGCVLLVVISAVGAVFYVNGRSTPKPKPAAITAAPAAPAPSSPKTDFPALAIQSVSIPAKIEILAINPAPVRPPSAVVEKKGEPTGTVPGAKAPAVEPVVAAVKPPLASPVIHALPDERVHVYLDALRIAGVRASGPSSRVILNEKVYRVNETVDRNLNLKLTAVETDFLKFTDSNGVEYQKTF